MKLDRQFWIGALFWVVAPCALVFWWAWYAESHGMAVDYSKPYRQRGETVHDTIYVHDTVVISKEKDTMYLPLKNIIGGRGIAIIGTENGIVIESTEKQKSLKFDYNDSELLIEKEEHPVIYPKK